MTQTLMSKMVLSREGRDKGSKEPTNSHRHKDKQGGAGQGGAGRDREGQGGKEAVNHNGFLGQHQQMWEKICKAVCAILDVFNEKRCFNIN